jgi:hypothetical protein
MFKILDRWLIKMEGSCGEARRSLGKIREAGRVPITVPRAVRFCGDFLGYFRLDISKDFRMNGVPSHQLTTSPLGQVRSSADMNRIWKEMCCAK